MNTNKYLIMVKRDYGDGYFRYEMKSGFYDGLYNEFKDGQSAIKCLDSLLCDMKIRAFKITESMSGQVGFLNIVAVNKGEEFQAVYYIDVRHRIYDSELHTWRLAQLDFEFIALALKQPFMLEYVKDRTFHNKEVVEVKIIP